MNKAPNFVGIGGQKCASTWLSECLRSHPEIFVSSPKELRYFVDNRERGFDWYISYFYPGRSHKYRGEFSSNYIYFPETAEEIKAALGDVKILAVVRDPVDRALSHIKHLIRDGVLPVMSGEVSREQLENMINKQPKILSNCFYQAGLEAYIKTFGESSVFVVNQSSCLEDSGKVLATLWEFLDVNPDVQVAEAGKVVSAGVNPKFHWLEKLRKRVFSFAKHRSPWLINWVKKSGVSSVYRKVNEGENLYFSSEANELIRRSCAEDWARTQELFSVK